jgi:hypothetical protein
MRRPWRKEGRGDDAVAIGLRKEIDARCVDARLNRGCRDMNRRRDGFQRVGYREVMTRINENGMHVQTQRSKSRGNGNQRRWFQNYYCQNQGACVIAITCPNQKVGREQDGPK